MKSGLPITDRASLSLAEGTLLWSMRVWVAALARLDAGPGGDAPGGQVVERIAAAFADLRAPVAASFLDGFMWSLRHGAVRTIGVECPCRPGIDPDERALLDVFALAQHGGGMEALLLLRGMVSPAASRTALASAERLGRLLADAGTVLALPARPGLAMFGLPAAAGRPVH